jgi:hypothetical protein
MNSEYSPIGTIRSPFAQPTDKPIQPTGAIGIQGRSRSSTSSERV